MFIVQNMAHMFGHCYSFNQPLDKWNLKNVYCINNMFEHCYEFNQCLNNWNLDHFYYDRYHYIITMFENSGMQKINYPKRNFLTRFFCFANF